jgi:hypothetical protein
LELALFHPTPQVKVKGKIIPVQAMKAYKLRRVISPLIVTLALQGDQIPQLKHKNIPFRKLWSER